MATIDSLRRRVQVLREQLDKHSMAKTWVLALMEDEEIPAAVSAKAGPYDKMVLRRYPLDLGLERQGDWCYGYVYWHGGALIITSDGSLRSKQVRR